MNMNKCRIFFFLFSFFNCTFLTIQAAISKPGKNVPKFIDYEKQALKLLKITAAPGCSINYKEVVLKLSPIAIQNAKFAQRKSKSAKRNSLDAGRYHFILLSRNKFVFIEDHYCVGMPIDDNEFREKIKQDMRFRDTPDEKINCKKHSKKWLWLLVKGDANIFHQLENLRKRLNYDAQRYLWFVMQIQSIFDVFNDDVHSPSYSLLDPKHINIENIGNYMDFLNPDVKDAMRLYYESEGLHVNIPYSKPNTITKATNIPSYVRMENYSISDGNIE